MWQLDCRPPRVAGSLTSTSWCRRTHLDLAEAALKAQGWGFPELSEYDTKYYREWMHELPPMVHEVRGSVIDLHHTILPRTARLHVDAGVLLERAVAVGSTHVLCPTHMVLHGAVHLFHDGEIAGAVRDLVDLDGLLRIFPTAEHDFFDRLTADAIELGLERPLFYALRYTNRLLGAPVPPSVWESTCPRSSVGPDVERHGQPCRTHAGGIKRACRAPVGLRALRPFALAADAAAAAGATPGTQGHRAMTGNAAAPQMDLRLRLTLAALAATFAAFSAYGSFVPLDFKRIAVADAIDTFARTPLVPLARASRSDFITNVLLFVPIGFFLLGALGGLGRQAYWLFLPVVAACLGLSIAIEFGQIFVSGRTPSWNDVLAETIGGSAGAALWIATRSRAVGWSARLTATGQPPERPVEPAGRLRGPLAGARRPAARLHHPAAGTGRKIPCRAYRAAAIRRPRNAGGQHRDRADGVARRRLRRPAWRESPVGVAACLRPALRRPRGCRARARAGAGGVPHGRRHRRRHEPAWHCRRGAAGVAESGSRGPHDQAGFRLWPLAALCAWCLVLIVRHWTPYDFVASGDFVRSRVPIMFRVPFHSYYWGMPLNSLAEALTKLLLAMPVGALLQATWMPGLLGGRRWQAVGIVLLSAGLFLAIEAGQLLLPIAGPGPDRRVSRRVRVLPRDGRHQAAASGPGALSATKGTSTSDKCARQRSSCLSAFLDIYPNNRVSRGLQSSSGLRDRKSFQV